MNKLEAIVRDESLEDVLAFFALKAGYPSIDRLYARYGQGKYSNLDILITYQRLVDEGVLVRATQYAVKGPNWKEPAFITERRYDHLIDD